MLSRIFWAGLAGIALILGMIIQDGNGIFSWGDHRSDISARTERTIEAAVDRAVDHGIDKMQVVDSSGREIGVPPEMRREMGEAVGSLVKAETDVAILRMRDASADEIKAAEGRRDRARGEVDRLKDAIEGQDKPAALESDTVREQIRSEIREDVRATVREAVGN